MPTKKQGLLQPLDIPERVWEEITIDFITHLPNSFGHTVVWVICDRLSKYVHFIGLPTRFSAKDIAIRFSTEICRLHGLPKSIVSDRDPLFLSNFWKELFRVQGTTLKYSSAYHPETDGQTEVVNRSLETYLRCFASEQPRKWYKFLHLAEYWYNSSFHSAIKMSPFEALYGRSPPSILSYVTGHSSHSDIDQTLAERQQLLTALKENLKRSRQKMEAQANKKRRDCTFEPGDLVLLRLQPYRQHTVHHRVSQKLSKRYYGPFPVIRRIGNVAYELDLPPSSRIHPVVHVSQLRTYHGDDPSSHFSSIPQELEDCVILEEDENSLGLVTKEPKMVVSKSLEKRGGENIQGSKTEEAGSLSCELEENNNLEQNLEQMKSVVRTEATDPLDTLLDTASEKVVPRTASIPLDQSDFSQVYSVPLYDCVTLNEQIFSHGPRPRVTTPLVGASHADPAPPFNLPNGPLSTLSHGPHASQGKLDASAFKNNKTNTFPFTPHSKTFFPPCDLSSPPLIPTIHKIHATPFDLPTTSHIESEPSTTLQSSSIMPNLEDKVFGGPDSDVSGPAVQKPKRKTFKPFWSKDFVSK
jgi:hypothetical protein